MKANARAGYFNGGTPPYSHWVKKLDDEHGNVTSKLEMSPAEAEIVKLIFKLCAEEGLGTKKIASVLNKKGLTKRKRTHWSKDNILAILHNPTYKGERIFNRYRSKTKKEKRESEWVKLKVDPIVDEAIFTQAQRIIKKNSREVTNPAVSSSSALFTGILKCGLCRKSMVLETVKKGQYLYYNCRGYTRQGSCQGKRIPTSLMEREVPEHLTIKFFSAKRRSLLFSQYINEIKKVKDLSKGERKAIQKEIIQEKARLENVYRAIEEGVVRKQNVDERIQQIKARISLLQEKLNRLRKLKHLPLSSHLFSVAFIRALRRRIKEVLSQNSSVAKRYLKLFIDSITVKDDNVTIITRKDFLANAISLRN